MSTLSNSTNCLVFRIVEKDTSPQKEDMDIFILYDSYHSLYLLRGKRSDIKHRPMKDYSFESYSQEAVVQFLSFIIPRERNCIFELYSYVDLPNNKNDVTFDFLRTTMNPATEVVAYVNQEMRNSNIRKILWILSEITNDYVPDETDYDDLYDQYDLHKWNAECSKRNEW
jgi:hypothetical protein